MGPNTKANSHGLPNLSPKRLILAASIAAMFCAVNTPALAADLEDVIDKLREKGVLTEEEYQEMRTDVRAEKRKEAMERATEAERREKAKDLPKVSAGPSLRVESADGQHSVGVIGRLHFDYRDLPDEYGSSNDRDSASLGSGFEVRRARIGISGKMFNDITYEVVTNVVGTGDLVDTAWLNLGYIKSIQFRMGRFKQPFSLEQLTSSNNIDFMERSYADQLVPAKKLGVMLHGEPIDGFTYATSYFQQDSRQQSEGDGFQAAARLTLNFSQLFKLPNSVLHLGVAGTDGHYQVRPATSSQTSSAASTATRATVVGFNSENRGLSNVYRAQIGGSTLATADFGASDEIAANVTKEMKGLEAALAFGPFKFQGEMVTASFDAFHQSAGQTVVGDVDTDYFELMWNITGEKWSDAYRGGIFSGIRPNNNFKPGSGLGAWQLGARLSSYDASDITNTGTSSREQNADKGETLTVGVNWLLNPNVKFMLDYSDTKFKGNSNGSSSTNVSRGDSKVVPLDVANPSPTAQDSEQIISLRTVLTF